MINTAGAFINQQPPRRVTWKRVGWGTKINMIIGLAWIIVWVIFTAAKEPPFWDHFILNSRGIPGSARLLELKRFRGTISKPPLYSIKLSFLDRQGRAVRADLWSYDPVIIARLSPESPVAIEYDPVKPERCRFAGHIIGFMDIAGVILILVGLSMFISSYFSARGRLDLLRNGAAATARVTRINAATRLLKSGPIMNVRYEFNTDDGKPAAGFYKTTRPPKEGERIVVVYDPRRPWKNLPA